MFPKTPGAGVESPREPRRRTWQRFPVWIRGCSTEQSLSLPPLLPRVVFLLSRYKAPGSAPAPGTALLLRARPCRAGVPRPSPRTRPGPRERRERRERRAHRAGGDGVSGAEPVPGPGVAQRERRLPAGFPQPRVCGCRPALPQVTKWLSLWPHHPSQRHPILQGPGCQCWCVSPQDCAGQLCLSPPAAGVGTMVGTTDSNGRRRLGVWCCMGGSWPLWGGSEEVEGALAHR